LEKSELKRKVCDAIEHRSQEIIEVAETILKNPESGFKEEKTAQLVKEKFDTLHLKYEDRLALTGVKARIEGVLPSPSVAVLGEMDGLICYPHPYADPKTGVAHTCGHNAQVAGMVGVGIGLVDSGVMDHLDGSVDLFAVPAEEYVELEFRLKLQEEGRIKFLEGKQELLRQGYFDDVDIAMMFHLSHSTPERKVTIGGGYNGFLAKTVKYIGRESHAGYTPHLGINALNAAILGLIAINAQRETFKEEDAVRIHPIITKGGDVVNVVPADVRLETFVRAKTVEGIMDANRKVNRALKAGADAVGAKVEVTDIPGCLPLSQNSDVSDLFRKNAIELMGPERVMEGVHNAASTDMGDVSQLIPSIHPHVGGVEGAAHSRDFIIVDPYMASVVPAKLMAMTLIDLLYDGARKAKEAVKSFRPLVPRDAYSTFWANLISAEHQDSARSL